MSFSEGRAARAKAVDGQIALIIKNQSRRLKSVGANSNTLDSQIKQLTALRQTLPPIQNAEDYTFPVENGRSFHPTAGMSGIYNDGNDVAFWAGSDLSGAIWTAMNPFKLNPPQGQTIAPFVVTHGGTVVANQAVIRGNIYATDGVFNGTIFATDGEFNGKVSIAGGKILLNKDGSGQLANGKISWDASGNPIFNGIVTSTDADGNVVTMDASRQRIELKNKFGDVMGYWTYYVPVEGGGQLYGSRIVLNSYDGSGTTTALLSKMTLNATSVTFEDFNSGETYQVGNLEAVLPSSVTLKNIPTGPATLSSGQVYRDTNTNQLMIVP